MTDEEIRIDYLVEVVGLKPSEARQFVKDNPSPNMGESFAILGQRLSELGEAIGKAAMALIGKK